MSRRVPLLRFRNPALPFPPLAPASDGSPASPVLSERSDFPSSIPARSLSFADRYHARLLVARQRGVAVGRLLVGTDAGASILCLRLALVETTGSPRFLGNPFANMPCSSTPADRIRQASKTYPMLPSARLTASAPRSVTFRGSITQPVHSLSTLRSSDYSDRTPRKTRFPLAANLVGAGLSPAGLLQEVSTLCFNSHRFPLLEASWRTNRRDAVTLAITQAARLPGRSRAVPASRQS